MDAQTTHPADRWQAELSQPASLTALRLAGMAGHMRRDKVAARRAALIDLLADGRSHSATDIWKVVAAQLGEDCWGAIPREALARDLATLREGGLRIAYTRRASIAGYYLQHPPLKRPSSPAYEAISWPLNEQIRQLAVAAKNERTFAAAEFALRQKRLVLAQQHPDWTEEQVEQLARQQVYGVGE